MHSFFFCPFELLDGSTFSIFNGVGLARASKVLEAFLQLIGGTSLKGHAKLQSCSSVMGSCPHL